MSKDCKEVFCDIYKRKVWGDGSGGGSIPAVARPYCEFISHYLINSGIYTAIDIGCGDLVVARGIDWGFTNYIGIEASTDWVSPMGTGRMIVLGGVDALTDLLPAADLVLCKEVLQHLSNEQVQLLLDRTAHYKRRLFTNSTFGDNVNEDIETGDFRPVDISLPPFNQPARTVFTYGHWIVQELTNP